MKVRNFAALENLENLVPDEFAARIREQFESEDLREVGFDEPRG